MIGERRIITHDNVRTFIPLAEPFRAMGYEVLPASSELFALSHSHIAAHFCCFYETLRRPLRRTLRLKRIAKLGIPTVTWNRDAPHYLNRRRWNLDLLEWLQPFEIYTSHSIQDSRRFGRSNRYLANAADTNRYFLTSPETTFRSLRHSEHYIYDVSFFGAMDGVRYKEMRTRQEFFAALAERLSARKVRFIFREAAGMSLADQIALIQHSVINLNYGASCEFGAKIASGLPERCFGVPACGGFFLCDKRTHARDDFTPGENWAEFEDLDDCVEKILFWLAHLDQARDLAERCYHHVVNHHTYAHRVETLHALLVEWHTHQMSAIA